MKRTSPALIYITLVCILQGCIYMESGVYFVDPVPSDPPTYTLSTNLDTLPDLSVTDSLEVIYRMDVENGEFYGVLGYLAKTQIFYSDSSQGSFLIYPYQAIQQGTDTLYMNFYISTNTNSLADLFKTEAKVVQRKYGLNF